MLAAVSPSNLVLSSVGLICIAAHPRPVFLNAVCDSLSVDALRLSALVAARRFKNEVLVEKVALCLSSTSEAIVGRALDVLTLLPGDKAKRAALDHFLKNSLDEAVADKIIRSLEAPVQGSDDFAAKIAQVIADYPDHPQVDGLIGLRERLLSGMKSSTLLEVNTSDVEELDNKIILRIPSYEKFGEEVKAALRAAEMPFHHPEMFQGRVDKSTSAVAFCKAIDLFLEKQLWRQRVYSKFKSSPRKFQNIIHMVGLNESSPSARRVREALCLEKYFTEQTLPLHKMSVVAHGILTGRIEFEHWRILDGLRAWAVVILLFGRGAFLNGKKPPIEFPGVEDSDIVKFSRRLLNLQDLRNPAAHRETWLQFPRIDEVRNEADMVFKEWQRMLS